MTQNTSIDYELVIQGAVRRAIRDIIAEVAQKGLPGNHHFYIDFLTNYPGAQIPSSLKEEYPEDMTIAIQYEFYDLTVDQDSFAVTLVFDDSEERIVVPFNAILKFADPSVDFGVEFTPVIPPTIDDPTTPSPGADLNTNQSNVISLDAFRKK